MIFVTVGTYGFDALVREVDLAVQRGEIDEEVVVQIGNGAYEPRHCQFFRSSPGLDAYYDRASLVIAHGGTGTTLEVLRRGLRLISVANTELQDNHQDEFLEALASAGVIDYCRDLADLAASVRRAKSLPPPSGTLATPWPALASQCERATPVGRRRGGLLRRWALSGLRRIRETPDSTTMET